MRSTIPVSAKALQAERPEWADEDVHFPESLVFEIVEEFTSIGDRVLDPFAGFGTTLVVSERMGRQAIGVELLSERVTAIRRRLGPGGVVVEGDARNLLELVEGPVDLCLTSPPYMNAVDHPQNPLNGYRTMDGDYPTYLNSLAEIFVAVVSLLRPGAHLVINAADIRTGSVVTPLAYEIKRELQTHATFVSETALIWDEAPAWLCGDFCMVFEKSIT